MAGLACGAINGFIITVLRLPPFIVTLGTWNVFGATFLWYSGSQTIRAQEVAAAAPFLQLPGTAWQLGGARLTLGTLIALALAAAVWFLLNRTPLAAMSMQPETTPRRRGSRASTRERCCSRSMRWPVRSAGSAPGC